MAKRSPPMPFIMGATTPIMALVAMAASTALPPCSRTCTPACAASGDSAATMPFLEMTMERAWPRSCAEVTPAETHVAVASVSKTRALLFSSILISLIPCPSRSTVYQCSPRTWEPVTWAWPLGAKLSHLCCERGKSDHLGTRPLQSLAVLRPSLRWRTHPYLLSQQIDRTGVRG